MAFLCFTILVQPNSIKARQDSNSRYLLVELDGSPDKDPGSDVTTEELEIPELEEEPTDDFNCKSGDTSCMYNNVLLHQQNIVAMTVNVLELTKR